MVVVGGGVPCGGGGFTIMPGCDTPIGPFGCSGAGAGAGKFGFGLTMFGAPWNWPG